MDYLTFKHPFTCIVAGPSGSGKSYLVREILKNYRLLTDIEKISIKVKWCYKRFQPIFHKGIAPNVRVDYYEGLDLIPGYDIMVVDDLMTDLGENKTFAELFTIDSRKDNFSLFFITHNLFYQGKYMRTISLNSKYIILMKNARGKAQLSVLCRDIFPGKSKYLIESYLDATSKPFGYLRIDCTAETPDKFRLSSDIIPENNKNKYSPVFYLPNG